MINDQDLLATRALSGKSETSIPFDSVRHPVGLQNLHRAFIETQPLAILNGESSTDRNELIDSFLSGLRDDVTVVRIGLTCSDAREGMRDVVRSTGFAPQNMNLIELEIMFVKFLSLQRFHGQRTVFLIEETEENKHWVRSKVRDLVDLEEAGTFGLMVILSRQAENDDTAELPILTEQVLLAANSSAMKKRKLFPRAPSTPVADSVTGIEAELPEWTLGMDSEATIPLKKLPFYDGKKLRDLVLEEPRLMIGRAEDNDLCINAHNVSRHHALLVRHGAAAVIMDLNSTNGTFVNAQRVKDQVVVNHDIIDIGDYRIRFLASNVQ